MAAGPARAEPGGANDVEPRVALAADGRLAGVQAHADAHVDAARPLVRGVRALRLDRCRDRVAGARKGEEERVALGVDLDPAERREVLAHQPAVLVEQLAVAVAELLQQQRRALDVAEDERDGPAGERGHAPQCDGCMASSEP